MPDKLRILVVDDSKVVRKAFSRILGQDYDLVEADDGEAAWEVLTTDPDICSVFTDLNMPHLDGIGLLERIRSSDDAEVKALPVILVTADGDDTDRTKKALTAGANDYIIKPFDSVFLRSKAQTYVKPRDKEIHDSNLATLDPLTKLANRTYFTERGEQDVSAANRHKTELALLLIAIDDFKGHMDNMDDKFLKGIIRKLGGYISSEVRKEDTVARIERDRFALLLPGTSLDPAVDMAERLREKIEQKTIRHNETVYKVTVSVGVSALPPMIVRSFEMLNLEAERRLREATKDEGNKVVPEPTAAKSKRPLFTSLDDALHMLDRREEKMSSEQAALTLKHMLPLLDYCNEILGLGLTDKLKKIKKNFGTVDKDEKKK